MMSAVLESALESLFRREVLAAGGRTEKLAATRKGMPDRLVLWPRGRIALVELKTETGRLSPAQKVWHDRAAELGTKVVVLYGPEQVRAWINEQREDVL